MTQEEFARRVEGEKHRLFRTARLYLGDETSALEAVDEAVYYALRAIGKLRQEEFFNTWLTRILINACKKELRRFKREWPEAVLPEEAADFDYDALPLKEAMARLPEELRQVVALRYFGGYTLAETAAALGIPQGTAVTRQRRALALLRLDLTEEGET